MCLRYQLQLEPAEVWEAVFGVPEPPDMEGEMEVFLGHQGLIVTRPEEGRILSAAQWGLVPPWAKDVSFGKQTYNARSETVREKPAFRNAFRLRRCLIPLSSFFEQDEGRWHQISPVDGSVVAAAGLFEGPNDVSPVMTYAMLTTVPNELVSRVQDRMPVLLDPTDYEVWLDPASHERDLVALLTPYPAERLKIEDAGSNRRKPVIQESLF